MAISIGNVSTNIGTISGGPPYVLSHDNASGDFLLVGIPRGYTGFTEEPNAVTYGGNAMTRVDTHTHTANARGLSVWKLAAPPAGVNNVSVTFTSDPGGAWLGGIIAVSFTGVNQSTPHGTVVEASSGSGSAVSGTASSSATGLVVDFATAGDTSIVTSATVGAGQTQQANSASALSGAGNIAMCSTEPGAASVSMDWTLDAAAAWKQTIVPLIAASGGGGPTLMGQIIN